MSRVPGIQYPDVEEATPVGRALRNIVDNLFYLRGKIDSQSTIPTVTTSEVREIVKELVPISSPSSSSSTYTQFIIGTHLERLTLYTPGSLPIGTGFIEYDRTSLYVVSNSTGTSRWKYIGGSMQAALSSIPVDLSTDDVGFEFVSTDSGQNTEYTWNGSAWWTIGGYLQEVADAATVTITTAQVLKHSTSAVAGQGFGLGVVTQLEDSGGTAQSAAYDTVAWENAGTTSVVRQWSSRVLGVLTALMGLESNGNLSIIGDYLWKSATNFFGTLAHANTVNRTYTFADADGNIVYETAALTNNNFTLGGGGALVKDAGFSTVPVANGGTGSTTAAGARSNLSAAQIQAPGGPHTVPLAKITGGGVDGSLTFNAEGVITGFVDPT